MGWTAQFYVSESGSDTGNGSKEAPFATLTRAREALRSLPKDPQTQDLMTVWIGAGTYPQEQTFLLTKQDSGFPNQPVVYKALPGAKVSIVGCQSVPAQRFVPVTDSALLSRISPEATGKIIELDLTAAKIRNVTPLPAVFGENWSMIELYYNGTRLPLSRWPNGAYNYTVMKSVVNSGDSKDGKEGGSFIYNGVEPNRWIAAVENGGVWLRGFWRVPWVKNGLKVKSIDPATQTITFAAPLGGGIGSKYAKSPDGQRHGDGTEPWFAMNLLEEIDLPGEWAVDFKSNKLYLWPPEGWPNGILTIADQDKPLISLQEVSDLRVEGLVIEQSLGNGMEIKGGERNRVAGVEFCNLGGSGLIARGGSHHEIWSNDFHDIGFAGLSLTGGERATLTPGGHQVLNNHLYQTGLKFPGAALIAGSGTGSPTVGNLIAHNLIHDVPNAGILFAGNDNIFEYNEVYRTAMDSGDVGSFYTNSGWTARGNILRYNFVHHSMNANAFYLDDGSAGTTVLGNIVYRNASGSFISGGQDNLIRNNIFIECKRAMHLDSRGVSRGYTLEDKRLGGDLNSVPYKTPPWSDRYPELAKINQIDPSRPHGNVMTTNVMIGCAKTLDLSGKPEELTDNTTQPNLILDNSSLFTDVEMLDFSLKDLAPVTKELPEFSPIGFEKIGLYLDTYRQQLPARNLQQLKEESTERRKFDSVTDMNASNKK